MLPINGARAGRLQQGAFECSVAPGGIAAFLVEDIKPVVRFQHKILARNKETGNDYGEIRTGNAKAMLFRLGDYARRLFLYLEDDDNRWRSVQLQYSVAGGETKTVRKDAYPFEFTVPLQQAAAVQCWLLLEKPDGTTVTSEKITLGN